MATLFLKFYCLYTYVQARAHEVEMMVARIAISRLNLIIIYTTSA